MSELAAISMENNPISIKDFILKKDEIDVESPEGIMIPRVKTKSNKPTIEYDVAYQNDSDIIIRKETTSATGRSKSAKILVILFSQRQLYIKNEGDESLKLDVSDLDIREFFKEVSPDSPVIDAIGQVGWIGRAIDVVEEFEVKDARRNLRSFSEFITCVFSDDFGYMLAKEGVLTTKDRSYMSNDGYVLIKRLLSAMEPPDHKYVFEIARASIEAARQYCYKTKGRNNKYRVAPTVRIGTGMVLEGIIIKQKYGVDIMRYYIERVLTSRQAYDTSFWGYYAVNDEYVRDLLKAVPEDRPKEAKMTPFIGWLMEDYNLEPRRCLDYIFSDMESQGIVVVESANIIAMYRDALDMQEKCYGKVRDKYPKKLKTQHDVYAMHYSYIARFEEDEKYDGVKQKYMHLEHECNGYVFRVPADAQDIVNEGIDQNHCVARMVNNVLEDETFIMYMRNAKYPDRSLITVELNGNNVVQAKGRHNRALKDAEIKAMRKWCEAMNLGLYIGQS